MRTVTMTDVVSVERKTTVTFPLWMQYALKGQKINAIKELRTLGSYKNTVDGQNNNLSLGGAKRIVEDFINGISTTTRDL